VTKPQTRCWWGPKEADHGATEPRLCSPWLGGPHTPSSVKQFKNWKIWPPHLGGPPVLGSLVWRGRAGGGRAKSAPASTTWAKS
jgi:hypothetical protein